MINIERELKMSLNKTEYETLLQAGRAEPQLQVNYYFYSCEMPKDVMLRIRVKNGKYLFCYKKLLSYVSGVNECDEREREIDGITANALIKNGLNPDVLKRFVGVDLPYVFKFAGVLSTYRAKFALDKWVIELDKNEYLGITDYELECECASNEFFGKLKDFLRYNYDIMFKPSLSKSARFFNKLLNE